MQTHHKSSVSGRKVFCSASVNKPFSPAASTAAFSGLAAILLFSSSALPLPKESWNIKTWMSEAEELQTHRFSWLQNILCLVSQKSFAVSSLLVYSDVPLQMKLVSLSKLFYFTGVKTRTELLKTKNRDESFRPEGVLHVVQRSEALQFVMRHQANV